MGSEHQINSVAYAAELQLFAYNSILYKSFDEASTRPNGLLAVSILIDVHDAEAPETATSSLRQQQQAETPPPEATGGTKTPSDHLRDLFDSIKKLKHRGSSVSIQALNLSALLPEIDNFVAYDGSLTTPGCHESVNWVVLNKPLYVSQENVSSFTSWSECAFLQSSLEAQR